MRFTAPKLENYELTLSRSEFVRTGRCERYLAVRDTLDKPCQFKRWSPVDTGVLYKVNSREYGEGKVQNLEVVGFRHICWLDWDWPDAGHMAKSCVTVTSFDDVLKLLHTSKDSWRVYVTPGGVRAACTSRYYHPSVMPRLGADPLYVDLCRKTEVFWARVSPKAERPHDWVAHHVTDIGKGKDEITSVVKIYHDDVIKHIRGVMSSAQLEMINKLI